MLFTRYHVPVVAVALVQCSCINVGGPSAWVNSEKSVHLDADAVHQLKAITHNGKIQVKAGQDDSTIEVDVTIRAGGRGFEDAQACLAAIDIQTPVDDGVQVVRSAWRTTKKHYWQAKVSYDITMPAALALQAITHNGGVDVSGIQGGTAVETHNGGVKITRDGGDLSAVAHNGSITAETDAANVQLKTHNGSITAVLSAVGTIGGHIETHNGALKLDINQAASTELDMSTYNGRIATKGVSLTDVQHSRNRLSGRLGSGGSRLVITTHNGGITLK